MITRRNLIKGLFAAVGAVVLKPFVKAEQPKIIKVNYNGSEKDYFIESNPNGNRDWFRDRYINNWHNDNVQADGSIKPQVNNWVHGSNSIDDVHFETPEAIRVVEEYINEGTYKGLGYWKLTGEGQ